jgi:ubiquinone/menaquinone biosynthesis C-methylase UbiE
MGIKLNLASGCDIRDGWINLDVVPRWPLARRGCDVIWDARKDKIPFTDNSVEEIYAGYLLLHLAPTYHRAVLAEIRRVLSPMGVALIHEVDMDIVMKRYINDPFDKSCHQLIWGEQGEIHGQEFTSFDKHCQGFTETTLKAQLTSNGFKDVNRIQIFSPDVWYELTISCKKAI